jgi:hypothetical protein
VAGEVIVRCSPLAATERGKKDSAKPFKGVDGGVFEIALNFIERDPPPSLFKIT